MQTEKNMRMARRIARAVAQAGGRTFFVGGLVRDRLLNIENKDIDIEVHGITPQMLREVLADFGEVTQMGASFGILGLRGWDIDIAMPRRENATGRGHKDFEVFVDPFLGTRQAALRRDFTMNALMEDVLTGEVLDYFGGVADLKDGVLRHVNAQTFAEDPLRVLRGAQFAARFSFTLAPQTVALSKTMDLTTLPKERIFGEMEKALRKADHPSVFFQTLREMNQLSYWFSEVADLIGVPQDPVHHPEGDVWNHTMMVLDAAAALREESSMVVPYLLSALCHDFGKVCTTVSDGARIHAYGHETAGLPLVEGFLKRITAEHKLIRYVLNMTKLHMRPNMMAAQHSGRKAMMHLFDEALCPEDLLLLAKADRMGRTKPAAYAETEAFLQRRLEEYRELMRQPCVQGRDLVAAGIAPGPAFSEALAYAHKLHLAGVKKETALRQTISYLKNCES